MREKTRWDVLSMKDRASLIKLYIQNGYTSIEDIKKHYNKFDNGGPKNGDQPTPAFLDSPLLNQMKASLDSVYKAPNKYVKTEYPFDAKNKYARISNNRYNTVYDILVEKGYNRNTADHLAKILVSQSIGESGWIDKDPQNNYAGYLDPVTRKKMSFKDEESFWNYHINNLDNKWPEWKEADNVNNYYNIINHTDLKLFTKEDFDNYNRAHRDAPVYIYSPVWENENYLSNLRSINNRASKYYPIKQQPILE